MPNNNIQKALFGCVDEFPYAMSSYLAFEIIRGFKDHRNSEHAEAEHRGALRTARVSQAAGTGAHSPRS